MTDLVTIAIPVFNRVTYFFEALESARNQTLKCRILIVDNASPDVDFFEVLKPYLSDTLVFHRNVRNIGMAANWNKCIELCRTPYILILHDDDKLEVDYVKRFTESIRTDYALFWSSTGIMSASGAPIANEWISKPEMFDNPKTWCVKNPCPAGAIFHRDTALSLGGFDVRLGYTPDFDLWFRLMLEKGAYYIPTRGAWYRIYNSSERITSQLERSGLTTILLRVQIKRNFHRYQQKFGVRPFDSVPLPVHIPLSVLLHLPRGVRSLIRKYFVAAWLKSKPITKSGRLIRKLASAVLGRAF